MEDRRKPIICVSSHMLGEMGIDEVLAEMGELSAEIQAG